MSVGRLLCGVPSAPGAATLAGLLILLLLSGACATVGDKGRPRDLPAGHSGPFTTWWNDTQPREIGRYEDGQRHGRVRRFHESGALEFDGRFVAGVPEGEFEIRDAAGRLLRREQWRDARLEGLQASFRPDGSWASTTEFRSGRPHGVHREYDSTGRLVVLEGEWREGLRAGAWRRFDAEGELRLESYTFFARGRPIGSVETQFLPGGRRVQVLKAEGEGLERSWMTAWHANGRQASVMSFVGGRQHGPDAAWSEDGLLLREGQWAEDERVGVWREWDEETAAERRTDYGPGGASSGAP